MVESRGGPPVTSTCMYTCMGVPPPCTCITQTVNKNKMMYLAFYKILSINPILKFENRPQVAQVAFNLLCNFKNILCNLPCNYVTTDFKLLISPPPPLRDGIRGIGHHDWMMWCQGFEHVRQASHHVSIHLSPHTSSCLTSYHSACVFIFVLLVLNMNLFLGG